MKQLSYTAGSGLTTYLPRCMNELAFEIVWFVRWGPETEDFVNHRAWWISKLVVYTLTTQSRWACDNLMGSFWYSLLVQSKETSFRRNFVDRIVKNSELSRDKSRQISPFDVILGSQLTGLKTTSHWARRMIFALPKVQRSAVWAGNEEFALEIPACLCWCVSFNS